MADLATSTPKTSWAFNTHLFIKPMDSAETDLAKDAFIFTDDSSKLASDTYDLGYIDEDGFELSAEDGDELVLTDINGEDVDRLKKEGKLTISFTLLKPSESTRGKFWSIGDSGEDGADHLRVKKMLTAQHYALAFGNVGPDAVGTEAVVFPFCTISANPAYAADKGWTIECEAKVLKGGSSDSATKFLMDFITLNASLLGLSE